MFVRNMMKTSILLGRLVIVLLSHFGSIGICIRGTLWLFGHLTTIQNILYGLQGHYQLEFDSVLAIHTRYFVSTQS